MCSRVLFCVLCFLYVVLVCRDLYSVVFNVECLLLMIVCFVLIVFGVNVWLFVRVSCLYYWCVWVCCFNCLFCVWTLFVFMIVIIVLWLRMFFVYTYIYIYILGCPDCFKKASLCCVFCCYVVVYSFLFVFVLVVCCVVCLVYCVLCDCVVVVLL